MFGVNISSGIHKLSGVDYYSYNSCNGICFILDDNHYYAIENKEDGYRSMIVKLSKNDICKKTFPAQKVKVIHEDIKNKNDDNNPSDSLNIYNLNRSLILKIENEHYDFYPCAVWEYHPENLPINKKK